MLLAALLICIAIIVITEKRTPRTESTFSMFPFKDRLGKCDL